MDYPRRVTITEVGPRDGLQNEPNFVPSPTKIELIDLLSETGLSHIEVTSFVSPKSIPQLADSALIFSRINKHPSIHYSALVPNMNGMNRALQLGVKEIAIFTAASDTFNKKNINCTIDESIDRFKEVMILAEQNKLFVRGYISCALGCPYEGRVPPKRVAEVAKRLQQLGVHEISFGDTIGVGTPQQTKALLDEVLLIIPLDSVAMHFHDTYGQAIANIYSSLEYGITHYDSSVAGLGGCPYARGATGNVATEDVLYLMHGLGIDTGIDIFKMVAVGDKICKAIGRRNQSKVANALLANQ